MQPHRRRPLGRACDELEELVLPPLEVVPIRVPLGPVQRELYDLLRSEAHRKAAGFNIQDRTYLRALGRHVMRLLEAASNPLLLASGAPVDDDISKTSEAGMRAFDLVREAAKREPGAKLREAKRRADASAAKGEKVLIWTAFTQNVLQLERELSHWGAVSIFGGVDTGSDQDDATREGKIRLFHTDDACRVMIANPAACGEGISLHRACHYAIYLDRTFNAAHYIQSVDRIHRLGLPPEQITRVEILEAAGTIDGRVASRMLTKLEAMARVLNDPGLEELAYDPEDVTEEFPAGIQIEDVEEVLEHLEGRDEGT